MHVDPGTLADGPSRSGLALDKGALYLLRYNRAPIRVTRVSQLAWSRKRAPRRHRSKAHEGPSGTEVLRWHCQLSRLVYEGKVHLRSRDSWKEEVGSGLRRQSSCNSRREQERGRVDVNKSRLRRSQSEHAGGGAREDTVGVNQRRGVLSGNRKSRAAENEASEKFVSPSQHDDVWGSVIGSMPTMASLRVATIILDADLIIPAQYVLRELKFRELAVVSSSYVLLQDWVPSPRGFSWMRAGQWTNSLETEVGILAAQTPERRRSYQRRMAYSIAKQYDYFVLRSSKIPNDL